MPTLTATQTQAANLLGAGHARDKVAELTKTHAGSISRWRKLPEFEAQVRKAERLHLDRHPSPRAQLESIAATAHDQSGHPDWHARIAAIKELRAWGVKDTAPTTPDPEDEDPRDRARAEDWLVCNADA